MVVFWWTQKYIEILQSVVFCAISTGSMMECECNLIQIWYVNEKAGSFMNQFKINECKTVFFLIIVNIINCNSFEASYLYYFQS